MNSNFISPKIVEYLLNEFQTKEFISQLDNICKKVDYASLLLLMTNFSIKKTSDVINFINQGKEIFEGINKPSNGIELISNESFESKCLFCSIGKSVNVYFATYSKTEWDLQVIYTNSFAINIEIKNGKLKDFGWCNAFLKESDLKKL